MTKNELQQSKNDCKLIEIYVSSAESEHFQVGFIEQINDTHVIVSLVSPSGLYDGYCAYSLELIYKICKDTQYLRKIYKLYLLKNQCHKSIAPCTDDLFFNLLKFAQDNTIIASLQINSSTDFDCQGFVINITDEMVKIEMYDDYGNQEGLEMLKRGDITIVKCDCIFEQDLKFLIE